MLWFIRMNECTKAAGKTILSMAEGMSSSKVAAAMMVSLIRELQLVSLDLST